MRLRVVGTCHYDPYGPSKLDQWLRNVRAVEKSDPEFVAVEGSRQVLASIRQQRNKLKELVRVVFEISDGATLDKMASTIHYEVDAPDAVYPGVPVVGLDDDDPLYDATKDYYAIYRLQLLSFVT